MFFFYQCDGIALKEKSLITKKRLHISKIHRCMNDMSNINGYLFIILARIYSTFI